MTKRYAAITDTDLRKLALERELAEIDAGWDLEDTLPSARHPEVQPYSEEFFKPQPDSLPPSQPEWAPDVQPELDIKQAGHGMVILLLCVGFLSVCLGLGFFLALLKV